MIRQSWSMSLVSLGIVALLVAACTPAQTQTATPVPSQPDSAITLKISGSGSTQRVLSAVEAAFEAEAPGYQLDILPGSGTGGGVKGVIDAQLDAAAMARPFNDEEMEAAPSLQYVEFGQGGVAVLVNPEIGLTELTSEQAVAIFSGEITNWSEVGGPDQAIIVYVRDENDSSTQVLRETIFGDMQFPETAELLTSQSDMEAAIEGMTTGIGFGAWPAVLASGAEVVGITLDGIALDDPANPTLKPLGLGFLGERQDDIQPLVDWLLSEDGQAALGKYGVVPAQ